MDILNLLRKVSATFKKLFRESRNSLKSGQLGQPLGHTYNQLLLKVVTLDSEELSSLSNWMVYHLDQRLFSSGLI